MPNVARVLREEIQRLARKQARAGVSPVKREQVRLKKGVADLRRQLAALSRTSQELVTKVTALVASQETEVPKEQAAGLRPTSRSLGALRSRLGLTQVQFGTLLGVSGQAVGQWESKGGRVRMRPATLGSLAGIQHIGRREARRRLESMIEPEPVRKGRRQ
jgi:DNA-binding transcriptional regulator YiaG